VNKFDWIQSQLIEGESIQDAVSRFNTPAEIDNPVAQQRIKKPIDLIALREIIPDAEAFAVLETRTWDRILDSIEKDNWISVGQHTRALLAGGKITTETVGKIQPLLAATIPDPDWQARITISPANSAGFDAVTIDEVIEASL
jgi:hypothetical protein